MLCLFVDYFCYNWESKRGAGKGKKGPPMTSHEVDMKQTKSVTEQEENETVSSDDDSDHESEMNNYIELPVEILFKNLKINEWI